VAWFTFTDASEDLFVVRIDDSVAVAHARGLLAGTETINQLIDGIVVTEPAAYNIGWSYHLDPDRSASLGGWFCAKRLWPMIDLLGLDPSTHGRRARARMFWLWILASSARKSSGGFRLRWDDELGAARIRLQPGALKRPSGDWGRSDAGGP
jgi:hypothetical protein